MWNLSRDDSRLLHPLEGKTPRLQVAQLQGILERVGALPEDSGLCELPEPKALQKLPAARHRVLASRKVATS